MSKIVQAHACAVRWAQNGQGTGHAEACRTDMADGVNRYPRKGMPRPDGRMVCCDFDWKGYAVFPHVSRLPKHNMRINPSARTDARPVRAGTLACSPTHENL